MKKFPDRFIWAVSTSAYQIEGAWREDGRGPSIWDSFSHIPGKVAANHTGDIACDHYHHLEEDVAGMKAMGLSAYRFSLSWSRLLPQGRGEINEAGIAFYNRLIDCLLDNGITPWVTLFHWDLPLALQFELDGLLNPEIADHFAGYAELCYERFGDRVKHWITLNEPWCSSVLGHGLGIKAPGRTNHDEAYISAHNLLRAHGKMVDVYRRKFQSTQKGVIGISNNCDWREPKTDTVKDRAAAQRALEFFLGWFADPVYFGDYPESMRAYVGKRLPVFTAAERELLKGSSDFFGLNHYTTMLAAESAGEPLTQEAVFSNAGIAEDQKVTVFDHPDWEKTDMGWNIASWGCRKLLQWIAERYDSPPIYLTENGCAFSGEDDPGVAVNDDRRIAFLNAYIGQCHQAIAEGVDLRGYFVWSYMDNFEWEHGYSKRFGLHHVDFTTGKRTPKNSARWYADVIKQNGLSD